jgi:hypothetical protein
MPRKPPVAPHPDFGDLPEGARIDIIGKRVASGETVEVRLDTEAKADRYMRRLRRRFPRVTEISRDVKPGAIVLKVGML